MRVNSAPFTYGASPGSLPTLRSSGGFLFGSQGYLRVELPEGNNAGPGTGATTIGTAFSLVISDGPRGGDVPLHADAVMQLGQVNRSWRVSPPRNMKTVAPSPFPSRKRERSVLPPGGM